MNHEVVIIGGGVGGVRVAKKLAQEKRIHVTLIDKSPYHVFQPFLYEVATAHIPEIQGKHLPIQFHELKSVVAYPIKDIFFDDLNVTVMQEDVISIDFKKQEIKLKKNTARHYETLVVAIGSETNFFGISGLYEYAYPLKTVFDALALRNVIDETFMRSAKSEKIKIVVGGGGFTGCEFTAELIGFLDKLAELHGRSKNNVEVTVVEGGATLLGGANPWAQKKAELRFKSLGIKLKFKKMIKSVSEKEITLSDNKKLSYTILVWTAGVQGNVLSKKFKDIKLERGTCICVDEYLRLEPYKNVFSIGDASYCIDKNTGSMLPMTAWVALQEANTAVENIKRRISGKSLKIHKPRHVGFIIPLGGRYALFDGFGLEITGIVAWWMKYIVALHYWSSIIGFGKAWKLFKRGITLFGKND